MLSPETRTPGQHGTASGIRIGALTVTPVRDGASSLRPEVLYGLAANHFPVLPGSRGMRAEHWRPYAHLLDNGLLELGFGGFLISGSGDRLILVDVGQGPTAWAPEPELEPKEYGKLLDSLADLGLTPADITDVVFTHLHFDHIGWASVGGAAVFANATYRCHADDLAHFVPSDPVVSAVLAPVLSQLETWDGDLTLAPGVDLRPAPGHTPGSTLVVLSSGGERLMLLGDVLHCPADLLDEHWAGLADVDPRLANQVRVALARELEQAAIAFAPAHFPGLRFGRLLSRADGSRDFSYLS